MAFEQPIDLDIQLCFYACQLAIFIFIDVIRCLAQILFPVLPTNEALKYLVPSGISNYPESNTATSNLQAR